MILVDLHNSSYNQFRKDSILINQLDLHGIVYTSAITF